MSSILGGGGRRMRRLPNFGVFMASVMGASLLPGSAAAALVVTNLEVSADALVPLEGGGLAFLRRESEAGPTPGTDLNGDGDLDDSTVHVWDGASFTNLGLATASERPIALGDGGVAFLVLEANNGGTDLNGDGDTLDSVVHVWDGATIVNLGYAGDNEHGTPLVALDVAGLAFLVPEQAQGGGGTDLNGDADTDDLVLHVWTGSSVSNLGLDLLLIDFPFDFDVGEVVATEGGGLALTVPEASQGSGSLNGDADTDDWVAHVWDGATVTSLGFEATFLVALQGGGLSFSVNENAQGNTDLNDDADTDDQVLFTASGTTAASLGYAVDVFRTLDGGGVAFIVPESSQGDTDFNGDSDIADSALFVWDGTTSQQIEVEIEGWLTPLNGGGVAFAASESPSGIDLNSDGDTEDHVVHVWTGSGVVNLAIATDDSARALRGGGLAVLVVESAQGGVDLNGDGDAVDHAVHVWDELTVMNLGYDAGNYEALNDDGAFAFNVVEDGQSEDLNGDGDMLDGVVFIWDGTTAAGVGVASEAHPSYAPLAEGGLAFLVSEPREAATDLDGDGDSDNLVLFVVSIGADTEFTFGGFRAPVDNPPVVNAGKAGRIFPLKWNITDAVGNEVTSLDAVNSITYDAVACGSFSGNPTDALETSATGGGGLRYDGQFIYNWKTPSLPGCYEVFVTLADDSVHTAHFRLN